MNSYVGDSYIKISNILKRDVQNEISFWLILLRAVNDPEVYLLGKVKVKLALEHIMKAQRGSRSIAVLFL